MNGRSRRATVQWVIPVLWAVVLAVVAGVLGACSDDDGSTSGEVSTPSPSLTSTTEADDAPSDTEPSDAEPSDTEPSDAPAVKLTDTAWVLATVERDGKVTDASDDVPAVVSFGEDTVDVYDGVNTGSGSYAVDGASVSFEMGRGTDFPPPAGEHLPQYDLIAQLAQVEEGVVENDRMVLSLIDGTELVLTLAGGVTQE